MTSGRDSASFLGTGWAFPPEFGPGGVGVAMVEGASDVHQSLRILCATRLGERPLQESFGCNLESLSFDKVNHAFVNGIETMIHDAVLKHEPRVRLRGVDVSQDPAEQGSVLIRLDYEIPNVNSRFNLVFPFYLNEARAAGG